MVIKYNHKFIDWRNLGKETNTAKEIEAPTLEVCFEAFWKRVKQFQYCNGDFLTIEDQYREQYNEFCKNMSIDKYIALGGDPW